MNAINWLSGKKTYIGGALLSLLGLIGSLDVLVNEGHVAWLTSEQYVAIGTMIAGLTGAAMRLAINKSSEVKPPSDINHMADTLKRLESSSESKEN
jgi:hypothetical protein